MEIDGNDAEELTKASGGVAAAGVVEASGWSNNKLLLAVIPPTLALLSVTVGVLFNARSDANDAELARDARAQEAQKEQEAIARDQEIRVAELVLPRYEALLGDVRTSMLALAECSEDIKVWTEPDIGITASEVSGAPPQAVPNADGTMTTYFDVRDTQAGEFLTTCAAIEDGLDPLVGSLDRALLVSEPELESAALRLEEELVGAARNARRIGTAATNSVIIGDETIDGVIVLEVDDTGRDIFDYIRELEAAVGRSDAAATDVINAVRGVLLAQGES
ncbi:MAG: hypothetical protein ACR2OH_00215 [Microthrixaceae bacterium]